jgi:hypothetical protein
MLTAMPEEVRRPSAHASITLTYDRSFKASCGRVATQSTSSASLRLVAYDAACLAPPMLMPVFSYFEPRLTTTCYGDITTYGISTLLTRRSPTGRRP